MSEDNTKMSSITLLEAQKAVDDWVQEAGGYWGPLSMLARLSEEVGELSRLLNHLYGDKPKKENEHPQEISEEIADILYTIICIANSEGLDLDISFQDMMQKLKTRDSDRFSR